jgi:lysophospholipase L1-like esterase
MKSSSRLIVGDSILKNVRHIKDSSIFSLSGAKLDDVTRLMPDIISSCPNTSSVLIHCGTNDVDSFDLDEIVSKFENLIKTINNINPETKILISSILPKFDKNGESDPRISKINKAIWDKCASWRCFFVASFKVLSHEDEPCSAYFLDGIHLNKDATLRVRQFMTQRLAEWGNKPQSPFSSATYLKRSQWMKGVSCHL